MAGQGAGAARGFAATRRHSSERAVALTEDPASCGSRPRGAGEPSGRRRSTPALRLLATAEARPLDEFQRARTDLLRQVHIEAPPSRASAATFPSSCSRLQDSCELLQPEAGRDLPRQPGALRSTPAISRKRTSCLRVPAIPMPRRTPVVAGCSRPLALLYWPASPLRRGRARRRDLDLRRAAKVLVGVPMANMLRCRWRGCVRQWALSELEGMLAIGMRQVELVHDAGALSGAAGPPLRVGHRGRQRGWAISRVPPRSSRRPRARSGGDRELPTHIALRLRALEGAKRGLALMAAHWGELRRR